MRMKTIQNITASASCSPVANSLPRRRSRSQCLDLWTVTNSYLLLAQTTGRATKSTGGGLFNEPVSYERSHDKRNRLFPQANSHDAEASTNKQRGHERDCLITHSKCADMEASRACTRFASNLVNKPKFGKAPTIEKRLTPPVLTSSLLHNQDPRPNIIEDDEISSRRPAGACASHEV